MAPAQSGELRRRSPSAANWSSSSVVLHVAVLVLLKVSLPRITPLSFPVAPSSFLFSTSTIAMDYSVSLASFASPASSLVDLWSAAMDSPFKVWSWWIYEGSFPSSLLSLALPSCPPLPNRQRRLRFSVSFSPARAHLIPDLVGALVSCPRMTPTVALPMVALPELHHFSTTGSWIPPPQIHRRPPTKLSKHSMSCAAEDPGLEWGPLWTPHIILLTFLEPHTGLRVHHASDEYGFCIIYFGGGGTTFKGHELFSSCLCRILGGLVYQRRLNLNMVYYISRPRSSDRIRYGSGGTTSTVWVDLRFLLKMVFRFDVWRREAIFLSPVMLIQNLRLKMFNPPRHRLVRQSRGAPAILSECNKEDS